MPVKTSTPSFQGRRFVKFKEPAEHSEGYCDSTKKEQRSDPHKITCVTQIMVDISDSDSKEFDDIDSKEKSVKSSEYDFSCKSVSDLPPSTVENKFLINPDKFEFMNKVRKRSQKEREKQNEAKEESKLTEEMVVRLHRGDSIKIPYINNALKNKNIKNIENILLKKFDNTKSVSKILQKTVKLQKNIEDKLDPEAINSGEAIRHLIMQRILGVQRQRAMVQNTLENLNNDTRNINRKCLKLNTQSIVDKKRKTRMFDLYQESELNFPDVNNLLRK